MKLSAHFPFFCLTGLRFFSLACFYIPVAVFASEVPAEFSSKISQEAWSKIERGELKELVVEFDDSDLEAEVKTEMLRRGLKVRDEAAIKTMAAKLPIIKKAVSSKFQSREAQVEHDFSHLPLAVMHFEKFEGIKKILQEKGVVAVYENRPLYAKLTESLPLIGQSAVANVMGRKGSGASVAVLDTGLNYTRSEFGSCSAPGVPSGCLVKAEYFAAGVSNTTSGSDDVGHGTEVAAVVAATAPQVGLIAVHVFNGGSASSTSILDGISWVIQNKSTYNIKAINLSLGDGVDHTSACTSPSDPYYTPINKARIAGIVVVVASGNENYTDGVSSPACVANALAVGAVYDANVGGQTYGGIPNCTDSVTAADKVACFSNSSATLLDVLAPGSKISVVGVTTQGTSFSAPFVAGGVAVLGSAFPSETPAQLESRITSTGKLITDTRNSVTKPRLDLLAAQGAPVNDSFSLATILTGDSGSLSAWNYNATKQSAEPSHAGGTGGTSVWWKWTATSNGVVTLDTHGSSFDTLLGVYTGNTVGALTAIASNDNDGSVGSASGLTFHAVTGTSYYFAVDGVSASTGSVVLNRSFLIDAADVSISLSVSPDPGAVGNVLTYSVLVTNSGALAASNVIATLNLPLNVNFVSASNGCSQAAGIVTCSLISLASGGSTSFNVSVTPLIAAALSAQASVSTSSTENSITNNNAVVSTVVNPIAVQVVADGDAPLPLWSLMMLALGLMFCMRNALLKR